MTPLQVTVCAAGMFGGSLAAQAADPSAPTGSPLHSGDWAAARFFVHAGFSGLFLNEGASVRAFGAKIPGATISIPEQYTFGLEAGYFVTPRFAIAVSGGVPPTARINGAGTVAAVGRLGSILYGPTAVTAQYHFTDFGPFQPYLGVGPTVMFVFSEKDGALKNLKVDSSVGVVGQLGTNYMFNETWGVFVDLKLAYLRTQAKGLLLGATPIKANVRLDPAVVSAGLNYKF